MQPSWRIEPWKPGERAFFAYRGPGTPQLENLRAVYSRSHQTVEVLGYDDSDGFGGPSGWQERMETGQPYCYRVRFYDGYVATATEDELFADEFAAVADDEEQAVKSPMAAAIVP